MTARMHIDEFEIVRLARLGMTDGQIAAEMGCTRRTISRRTAADPALRAEVRAIRRALRRTHQGSQRGYRHGCHCAACRSAHNAYNRARRHRQAAYAAGESCSGREELASVELSTLAAVLGRGDTDWQAAALCAQTDPDAFFPEGRGASTREAKAICRRCEVTAECLAHAIAHDETDGVWGGLSERERWRLTRDVTKDVAS